jgi:integrase
LAKLKRENEFVFASPSKAGRISDARHSHTKVLASSGIEHLTIHGLRRTFIQRARAVVPAGVPAQIAGQKPSAVAEGYAVLAMDDLRAYAVQVEASILSLAGVQFDAELEPGKLRVVQAA